MMITYTTKEVVEAYAKQHGRAISRQRLHQLQKGWKRRVNGTEYDVAPVLTPQQDWFYSQEDGRPRFTESGLQKILHR